MAPFNGYVLQYLVRRFSHKMRTGTNQLIMGAVTIEDAHCGQLVIDCPDDVMRSVINHKRLKRISVGFFQGKLK